MDNWPRVKALFFDAVDRPPADRAALLYASCSDDPAVRAEVERLLAAHDDASRFIEHSPVAPSERMIGHYRIEQLIGVGGMGEVYRARDLELGRTVAIKLALGHDADAHARLRREAQHASQLNHPNIATIYEVANADGHLFIAMEFVDGRRLCELIPEGGLSPDLVTAYGKQVADALAHAHRHGVIHRDLKTANVVVTSDGYVKVLDFGLARRATPDTLKELTESHQSITAEGMIAGTHACMAPELFRGATADARSDIWALGVLLYEITTGKRPFTGGTGFELTAAIMHDAPRPFPASVPESLRSIALRCLEKDPGVRYQMADEVRRALEGTAAAMSARRSARPSSWRYAVAGLVAIALSAGAFSLYRDSRAAAPVAAGASGRPAIAVMNFASAGAADAGWLSQGIPTMLLTGLAQTRGLDIVSSQRLHEVARAQGYENLAALEPARAAAVAKQAGAGAIIVGSIHKAGAEIRIDARVEALDTGRVLAAESVRGTDAFSLVDQLASRIRIGVGLPHDPAIRGVADISTSSLDAFRLFSEAAGALTNARGADAARALEEAVRIDPTFAEAYLELASAAGFSGQPVLREQYLHKAAEHADRLSEPKRLLLNLQIARNVGNIPEAARLLDELLARYPETEEIYTIAALFYRSEVRDRDKLDRILRNGVSTLPNSPSVRNDYGYVLLARGEYPEAIREFEKYAELAPREANPYDSLAEGYLTSGSPERAIETYTRGLALDPLFSASRIGLSWSLGTLGRFDAALDAKPPLEYEEAYLLSRVGRHREAEVLLGSGARQADNIKNLALHSVNLELLAMLALERKEHPRALHELAVAEKVIAADTAVRRNRHRVVLHLLGGLAELGAGRADAARARLRLMREFYTPAAEDERLWYQSLEGEIALAGGDLDRASAAFAMAEPSVRIQLRWDASTATILANSSPFRDGPARVAIARGDLRGAIELYRRLLVYGPESKFISVVEPKYVLALAGLLERAGDKQGALKEYARFLDYWKQADSDLPELAEARHAVARLSR